MNSQSNNGREVIVSITPEDLDTIFGTNYISYNFSVVSDLVKDKYRSMLDSLKSSFTEEKAQAILNHPDFLEDNEDFIKKKLLECTFKRLMNEQSLSFEDALASEINKDNLSKIIKDLKDETFETLLEYCSNSGSGFDF